MAKKLLAARVAWSNADNAVQIHGGNGYAIEYPISRLLCDARILNIFEEAPRKSRRRSSLAGCWRDETDSFPSTPYLVVAGLVPAIHAFRSAIIYVSVDARNKSGHDDREVVVSLSRQTPD